MAKILYIMCIDNALYLKKPTTKNNKIYKNIVKVIRTKSLHTWIYTVNNAHYIIAHAREI